MGINDDPIPNDELVKRAVELAHGADFTDYKTKSEVVQNIFGLSKNAGDALCRRYDYNPKGPIKKSKIECALTLESLWRELNARPYTVIYTLLTMLGTLLVIEDIARTTGILILIVRAIWGFAAISDFFSRSNQ